MNSSAEEFKQYICVVCGWTYDEQHGVPESNLAPGTRWSDVAAEWTCPDCGAAREDFDDVVV